MKRKHIMPTYEFKCSDEECGVITSQLLPMNTPTKAVSCRECGKPAKRIISAPIGLRFHGSGFHSTDYSKTGPKE